MNKSIVLMIYDTWESTSGSLAIMAITDPKNPIGHDRHGGEISPNQVVVYECLWNVAWDNIFMVLWITHQGLSIFLGISVVGVRSRPTNRTAPKLSHVFATVERDMDLPWIYRYSLDMDGHGMFMDFLWKVGLRHTETVDFLWIF